MGDARGGAIRDLSILLDEGDRIRAPGEKLTGAVQVVVDGDWVPVRLVVQRAWRARGHGKDTGAEKRVLLFDGFRRSGQYRYPFEFDVDEPLTYHGRVLNLDWYLTATVESPPCQDLRVEREFLVESAARIVERGAAAIWNPPPPDPPPPEKPGGDGCLVTVVGAIAVMLLVLLLRGVAVALALGLLAVAVCAVGVISFARWFDWRTCVGRIELEIPTAVRHRGQQVRCAIHLRRTGPQVVFSLLAAEVLRNYDDPPDIVPLLRLPFPVDRPVRQGERWEYAALLSIPEDAPPSFRTKTDDLCWTIEARMSAPGLPDWIEQRDLEVRV